MKTILTISLSLLFHLGHGQQSLPYIQNIVKNERVFNGNIGGLYPITMSLRFAQYSNYHLGTYSVIGWYHYDKIGSKISLTGFYDWSNGLTLYAFNDSNKDSVMINFLEMKSNHWAEVEYYKELGDYNEKFSISEKKDFCDGLWKKGEKTLGMLLNTLSLDILKEDNFLHLDSMNVFDLSEAGISGDIEILAVNTNKTRILIRNEWHSNPNIMGRCGAGNETELVILLFNSRKQYQGKENYVVESCYDNIYTVKINSNGPHIDEYIVDYGLDEKEVKLIVNKELVTINSN